MMRTSTFTRHSKWLGAVVLSLQTLLNVPAFAATAATPGSNLIWISDKTSLYQIDAAQASLRRSIPLPGAIALAADTQGQVWVLANGSLLHYSSAAANDLILSLKSLDLSAANALRIDPHDGAVWVSDGIKLVRVTSDGKTQLKQLAPQTLADQTVGLDQTLWLLGDKTLNQYGVIGADSGRLLASFAVDGLPSPAQFVAIDTLHQFAWLASAKSLALLDLTGARTRIDNVLSEAPTSIVADSRSGSLWVLSPNGLTGFTLDSLHGDLQRRSVDLARLHITHPTHIALEQTGQFVWLVHDLGLSRVDPNGPTATLAQGLLPNTAQPGSFVALSASTFDVNPNLTLREPTFGSALTTDSRLLFDVSALCPEGPCALDSTYYANVEVSGLLGSASLGRLPVNPANRQAQFQLDPSLGLTGKVTLSAQAIDIAGHRSPPLAGSFDLPAPALTTNKVNTTSPTTSNSPHGVIAGGSTAAVVDSSATASSVQATIPTTDSPNASAQTTTQSGVRPVVFEINQGQHAASVRFYARHGDMEAAIGTAKTSYAMHRKNPDDFKAALAELKELTKAGKPGAHMREVRTDTDQAHVSLVGANANPEIVGLDLQQSYSNYLVGNEPSKWHTHVPHYGRVLLKQIYPGIDEVHTGASGSLEHDFIVAPGADPARIRQHVDGASSIQLDPSGNLVIHSKVGDLVLNKPIIYQDAVDADPKHRRLIDGSYSILRSNEYGFNLGIYDKTKPLVIDPAVVYTASIAASGANIKAIAADSSGSVYVSGEVKTAVFSGTTTSIGATHSVFIQKLKSDGSQILWTTYIGEQTTSPGTPTTVASTLAVDSSGAVYFAGTTSAVDLPTTTNAYQKAVNKTYVKFERAYIGKLMPSGAGLSYLTLLTGSDDNDGATAIAIDQYGYAYVAGYVNSTDFPVTTGMSSGNRYIAKLDQNGATLVYSNRFGSTRPGYQNFTTLAVDSAGEAYVAGNTDAAYIAVTPGALNQNNPSGSQNESALWVMKFNPGGDTIISAAHLSVPQSCHYASVNGLALDASNNPYLTGMALAQSGYTRAGKPELFPPCNKSDAELQSNIDIKPNAFIYQGWAPFVAKLSSDLSARSYLSFLGGYINPVNYGSCFNSVNAISIDNIGSAYIVGQSTLADFPVINQIPGTPNKTPDGNCLNFVARLNPSGQAFTYSTARNASNDPTSAIATDPSGNVYVAGGTTVSKISADISTLGLRLESSKPQAVVGTDLNFTAIVSGGSSPQTGTVVLTEGSNTLASNSLDSTGHANLHPPKLSVGQHILTATYSGSGGSASTQFYQFVFSPFTTQTTVIALNPDYWDTNMSSAKLIQITTRCSIDRTDGAIISPNLPMAVIIKDNDKPLIELPLGNGPIVGVSPFECLAFYNYDASALSGGRHSLSATFVGNSELQASSTTSPLIFYLSEVSQGVSQYGPTVTVSSPSAGQNFTAGSTVAITANAAVGSNPISLYEFFQGNTKLWSGGSNSYSWTNVPVGNYSLTVRVTDTAGFVTQSAPVQITVGTPLSATITSPGDQSTLVAPAAMQLAATVQKAAGQTVQRVDYYQGSNLIGTSTVAPYALAWGNVATGTYILTATVTDTTGKTATSNPIVVKVLDAVTKPGSETITYIHNDLAGSPVAATNAAGNVVWRESYQPFGGRIDQSPAAAGNRQFFHGKPSDSESGLSYFGARYYDPVIGKFYGVDPKDPTPADWHSFNRYAYGNNNTYKYIDPDGRSVYAIAFIGIGFGLFIAGQEYIHNPETQAKTQAAARSFVNSVKNVFKSDSDDATPKGDSATEAPIEGVREGRKLPDDRLKKAPGKRGNAPIGDDDHPVELHHDGQEQDSPLDEMTRTEHRGEGNFKDNHKNTGQEKSKIDRPTADKIRRDYWKKEWDNGRFDHLD